ncbi:membrane protein insertase YidC [Bacteroidota bacterium]|nr:membrane protein insertase YidC [Bacteroidota bacterium]
MKNKDSSSLVGFVLIAIVLIFFNVFIFPKFQPEEKETASQSIKDFSRNDNLLKNEEVLDDIISEKLFTLENEKIKLLISNIGGRINEVILKEYKNYSGEELKLFTADSTSFSLDFLTNQNIKTENRNFIAIDSSSNFLKLRCLVSNDSYIDYVYTIDNDYKVDFNLEFDGLDELIPRNVNYMNLEWKMKTPQTEKSKKNQEMYTGIYYQFKADNEVDNLSLTKDSEKDIKSNLNWVAFKQQFFSAIFISKNGFSKPISLKVSKNENSIYIKELSAKFEIPYSHNSTEKHSFQFYFGPNHYPTLKNYDSGFEEIIPLGWSLFRWVNKYIIINLFDFLSKYFNNYGLIILLLTIIIKLALAPFTYKAYLSQAKMKVLKPEIDKISDKDKDPMKVQQATMNLYRKAGVNPMGGCLPMLFQFPILIAMFRFFPASIELRQKSFLWADDLSAYDSILELGFNIPFYGDHVSLFTLLMTISTLLYTRMNTSMATGQMAQMKWMMYLMPIMFLGFFNNYAAALSYYYFLANMFTFGQQYFMKKFFINDDALLAEIEKNKRKPRKKSNFQKRLEQMQKQQEMKMKKRK